MFLDDFNGDIIKQKHSNLSLINHNGIIISKTSFTSKNDILGNDFPFKMPFHPGKGPDVDYPEGPYEPEEPDEDPGDEPDD